MKKIIGICGFLGSGKNTVADILTKKYGFAQDSFARTLKDTVAVLFGMDRTMLEGATKESRALRDVPDEYWSKKLGYKATPRVILQKVGTEVVRENLHEDFWVSTLEKRIIDTDKSIVVTDVRFPNEIDMIKANGGHVVWVKRGELPDWFRQAVEYNLGMDDSMGFRSDVHPSEYSWCGNRNIEWVINNDGTLEELEKEVEKFYKTL